MSSQKRRVDEEAAGRAGKRATDSYDKEYFEALIGGSQIKDLRAEVERLKSESEKLRTKPSSDGGASSNTIVGKNDQDYLAKELNHVYKVTSELDLNLQKPTDHRELSILCGVICDKEKLVHLKTFISDPLSFRFYKGCLFCLQQVGLGAKAPILAFGEVALRCQPHQDGDTCVWISKRENGWFIETGRG